MPSQHMRRTSFSDLAVGKDCAVESRDHFLDEAVGSGLVDLLGCPLGPKHIVQRVTSAAGIGIARDERVALYPPRKSTTVCGLRTDQRAHAHAHTGLTQTERSDGSEVRR